MWRLLTTEPPPWVKPFLFLSAPPPPDSAGGTGGSCSGPQTAEDEFPASSPIAGRLRGRRDKPAKLWSSSPQIEWCADQLSPSTPQPCCLAHGWEQLPPRRRTEGRNSCHHRIGDSLDLTTATWNIGPRDRADRADPGPPDDESPEDQELTKENGGGMEPRATSLHHRWTEALPTKKKTANVVTKKLLDDIFPRYEIPQILGSDNGPAFVSQVSQEVARLLGIDWKLHCAYSPQSSGQVERANKTIKETLTKLTLATGTRDWVLLLPLALYRAQNTPGPHGLTPFEIMYGAPPPIVNFLYSDISSFATSPPTDAKDGVKTPACREQLNRPVVPHPFKIGDSVWVRRHQSRNLKPRLTGQRLGSTRRM
ncbi:uncharacterized protein LOC143266914 isoform X1 [Peromyscus maniculatus bairdii]|uniref:uncharacterized protein LOC143266914 isoform X1 n=1 Tax=Peromyscus maniculatus bairdii TaxID=230844 RepID=UPI003FD5EF9F